MEYIELRQEPAERGEDVQGRTASSAKKGCDVLFHGFLTLLADNAAKNNRIFLISAKKAKKLSFLLYLISEMVYISISIFYLLSSAAIPKRRRPETEFVQVPGKQRFSEGEEGRL